MAISPETKAHMAATDKAIQLFKLWDAAELVGNCWLEIFDHNHNGAVDALIEWAHNNGHEVSQRGQNATENCPAYDVFNVECSNGTKITVFQ